MADGFFLFTGIPPIFFKKKPNGKKNQSFFMKKYVLRLIAEYDSKDVALGATYLLFNHLHAQVELQNLKYFSGGLMFCFNLK